jgi:tRNA-specific 2-thiouridylase
MPGKKRKVVVAMSGGVDSSVAAALLVKAGYDVTGVTMRLVDLPAEFCRSEELRSCCGRLAVEDANRVAVALGIPHFVADMRVPFEQKVVANFCQEYELGRTPNPCIRCNRFIKFGLLLRKARAIGADLIATGHYARIERDSRTGLFLLKKGKDATKDQSYFLYQMTQKELSHTLVPIGGFKKAEVRRMAKRMRLPVAEKPESQEICFVPDDDYPGFLRGRIPGAFLPGAIVDSNGRVIGEHGGIGHFTIGQRRGLGIPSPRPLFVIAIDAASNTVVAGPDEALRGKSLMASGMTLVSGEKLEGPIKARVKIRHRHAEGKAIITPRGKSSARIDFEKVQRAITPGQAVVFYSRNTVLGGATIDKAL